MDYRFVTTTCPYCGCGCQMLLEVMDGRLTGTIPLKTAPMNEGKLCIKGWNAHEFVHSPERLTTPLIRRNGKLVQPRGKRRLTSRSLVSKRSERSTAGTASGSSPRPAALMKTTICCRNSAGPASGPTTSITAPVSDTLPQWQVLPLHSEVEQ